MAGEDVSMGSAPTSPSPEGQIIDSKVHTRLASLCSLDERIAGILTHGSAVASTIAQGKMPGNPEAKKAEFKAALEHYNSLVEEVNGKLRSEIRLLHDESHAQLLPLYVTTQASSFGREKEDMIFKSLEKYQ